MAITSPEAIRYVNEVVRPLCERLQVLKADIDAARVAYDGGIGDNFYGHDAEDIEDGREAEGVSRLTGNDVLAFTANILYGLRDALEANNGEVVISKPCVRHLIS